nr:flagellin [uncultured Cupriavidus sp.]
MAQVINTNSLSLMTQNNLTASQSSLNTAIQRLSSGLRINSAKDDAAGQAIANRFTANIRGLTQAQRNANDGISLAQTTEGALTEVNNNLQRIRELSVQSANGSNSSSDLQSIQDEIAQRLAEIDRTSAQTDFNGVKVLSGAAKPLTIQVGANDGETISINLSEISSKTLGLSGFSVAGKVNTAATLTDVQNSQTAADKAVATLPANTYQVTTSNTAATSKQVLSKLSDGDTVAVGGGSTYTYDAKAGNFKYTANVAAAGVAAEAAKLTPASGKNTAVYTNLSASSASTSFEIDTAGKITIGGQAAYLDAGGNLTTNNAGGLTQTTVSAVMGAAAGAAAGAASVAVGSTTYKSDGAGGLNYNATATSDQVETALAAAASNSTVTFAPGSLMTGTATLTQATQTWDVFTDSTGSLTKTASYTTNYAVDTTTGKVTVAAGGTAANNAANVGKTANIDANGKLTTDAISAGSSTTDPLAVLDKALSTVDKLRSSLGAVQNRLDSTISNLGTTITNLSSSRSRIQDADYATEVSNMTRANILQQAGTSVLAQANQSTQNVLSLLR